MCQRHQYNIYLNRHSACCTARIFRTGVSGPLPRRISSSRIRFCSKTFYHNEKENIHDNNENARHKRYQRFKWYNRKQVI